MSKDCCSAKSTLKLEYTHLNPTMLDSVAERIASIILSCHLQSPVFIACSLLSDQHNYYDEASVPLDVHRHTCFSDDHRYVS